MRSNDTHFKRMQLIGQVVGHETHDWQHSDDENSKARADEPAYAREVSFGGREDMFVSEDGQSYPKPDGDRVRCRGEIDVENHKLHPGFTETQPVQEILGVVFRLG